MLVSRTTANKIYVDEFDIILSYFKKMDSNWATNSISVVFPNGTTHLVRGFMGITNPNSHQEILYGAFSWNHGGNLEEIVFELSRVRGGVNIFISSSLTTLGHADEYRAVRKFLNSSLIKIHDKFIRKTLGRPTQAPRMIRPFLKAMPRHYNPCRQVHYQARLNNLFTQYFVNLANRLRIHFS